MIGVAAVYWANWKTRNKACFEKKLIKSSIEILLYACVLMKHWAGLSQEGMQDFIREGAKACHARMPVCQAPQAADCAGIAWALLSDKRQLAVAGFSSEVSD